MLGIRLGVLLRKVPSRASFFSATANSYFTDNFHNVTCYRVLSLILPRPTVDGRRKRRNEAEPGKKNKRERSGDKGDGAREEKEKKFPWQADEQVDEGQSGRDTMKEKRGKRGGIGPAYYVKRT